MARSLYALLALALLAFTSNPTDVDAQAVTGTCPAANQDTFNACVRISVLDANNQTGASNPKDACQAIANDEAAYYCCLCHNYQRGEFFIMF